MKVCEMHLPHPDCPIMAYILPGSNVADTLRNICVVVSFPAQ